MSQVLVGLHRIGIVGLRQACERVAGEGLDHRDEIVDFLHAELAANNFIPEGQDTDYRLALWREYLRFAGRDFSEFFSAIEVTIRGDPGKDRDQLAGLCADVLADFELRPEIEYVAADSEDQRPQLAIGGMAIASGLPSRRAFKATVRQRLSDW